jgi:hypothetical protein
MERNLTSTEIDKIINFGALNYTAEQSIIVLGWDLEFMKSQINDVNSEFNINYNKGMVLNQYIIDTKLLEMAQSGDLKAIDMLEKRKNK